MNHRLDPVRSKQRAQTVRIADVALTEGGPATADVGNTFEYFGAAVGVIVEDQDILAGSQKLNHGMRTDIAGAASHENHENPAGKLARPEGLEPPTCRLEGGCSIQLSYGR